MPNDEILNAHDHQAAIIKRGNYTMVPKELLEAVGKGFISSDEYFAVCEIFNKIPAFNMGVKK